MRGRLHNDRMGQDKDMKEFTVTDKNGEKRVETLLMSE